MVALSDCEYNEMFKEREEENHLSNALVEAAQGRSFTPVVVL